MYKVGDCVRFEMDQRGYYPRWNFGDDGGESGNYKEGEVVETHNPISPTHRWFIVKYYLDGNPDQRLWNFCQEDYGKPGFPQVISQHGPVRQFCECGASRVFGVGPGGLHSVWCPIYVRST